MRLVWNSKAQAPAAHFSIFVGDKMGDMCHGWEGEMHDFYILCVFKKILNLGRIPEKSYILN